MPTPQILRVWINPGHGLNNRTASPETFDSGAVCGSHQEHAIVSAISDEVVDLYFNAHSSEVTVIPTPVCSTDCVRHHKRNDAGKPVSHLSYTVGYLNQNYAKFDGVLALHMNAAPDDKRGARSGVEVYYSIKGGGLRQKQAEKIGKAFAAAAGLPFRGSHPSGDSQHSSLAILDSTTAPAFLIECGYIDNDKDVACVQERGVDAVIAAIHVLTETK